jgi:membrane carboxypeptidase/penicillin-binding protein PbpC
LNYALGEEFVDCQQIHTLNQNIMRIQPERFPSIKRMLIRLHTDLFTINDKAIPYAEWVGQLNSFEKLVLVLEDRRFFKHNGVDWLAAGRELVKLITFRRVGGASTIDMQFVRTATGFREKTFRRKLYEILLARIIQFRYSKIVILRSYLACAFFGSRVYGSEKAAAKIFAKRVAMLDDQQAAELAAMLVYPRPLRPEGKWSAKVKRCAAYGLHWKRRLEQRFEKIPARE